MKKFILLIIAISLSFIYTFKGFSQTSYYAADIVKVDTENEIIYSILDGDVVVFDLKSQQILNIIKPLNSMSLITTIDLNQNILAFLSSSECCIVDLKTNDKVQFDINEENAYPHQVRAKFNADHSKIYIAREKDKFVKVYDTKTGKLIEKAFSLEGASISNMAMSPDRKTLVTTTANFSSKKVEYFIVFWDVESQKELKKVAIPGQPICLKFSPDGSEVGAGFQMSDIKKQAKKSFECDRATRNWELGIQIFNTESKKLSREFPIFAMFKGHIRDFEFDPSNKDVIYSIYEKSQTFKYDMSNNVVTELYNIGGAPFLLYKNFLITKDDFLYNESLTFLNTNDFKNILKFNHVKTETFYLDQDFVNSGLDAPYQFVMYNYNTTDVKWLFINQKGEYDCFGDLNDLMKATYFRGFKPILKKPGLLKEYSNPDFDLKLAQFFYDSKWEGNRCKKEVFEYSNIPFDYYEILKLKRPEPEVPDHQLTDQEWEEQFALAKETLIKNGFTIVDAKMRLGSDYTIGVEIEDQNSGIACVAFCEEGPGKIWVDGRPTYYLKEIPLKKEKGKKLFTGYNISDYKPGKYSCSVYGFGKTFLVVGVKKGATPVALSPSEKEAQIIENTKKDMEQRGYKIVEIKTATVGYGNPIIIPFDYSGEFAWTAIGSKDVGAISIYTNGVINGQTFIKDDFSINSGTVDVQNRIEFRATATQSNAKKITIIIGVK